MNWNKSNTKAEDAEPESGVAAATIRRTAGVRVEVPATATYDTERASIRARALWVSRRRSCVIVTCIPILAPFKYIAVHVIKTESVRSQSAYRMGLVVALSPVLIIPANFTKV